VCDRKSAVEEKVRDRKAHVGAEAREAIPALKRKGTSLAWNIFLFDVSNISEYGIPESSGSGYATPVEPLPEASLPQERT
jgi:hypothetical protein